MSSRLGIFGDVVNGSPKLAGADNLTPTGGVSQPAVLFSAMSSVDTNPGSIWSGSVRAITLANVLVIAMSAFDGLAVVAVLPSITEDLGRVALAPWVLTSYLGVSAVAGIAAGPIIDAVGVRRTFRATGLWFLITTAAVAVAPTMELLIVARVLQGLGGGLVISVGLASVAVAYPAALRPRALAANSVVWGLMGFGGPAIVGALLSVADWRWVFGVQVPLTALALVFGWNRLPSTRSRPVRIVTDWFGLGVLAVFSAALIATASLVGQQWLMAAGAVVLAAIAGATYWRHSGSSVAPVMARRHFVDSPFGRLHLTVGLVLAAGLTDAYLPLYAQAVRGWSESAAAFSVIFLTVGWTTAAVVMARLLDSWSESFGIAVGATIMIPATASASLFVWIDAPFAVILGSYFVVGLSLGATTNAAWSLLQSSSLTSEAGRANSSHQFLRSLSVTIAVALSGAVLLWVVDRQTGDVESVRKLLAGDSDADAVDAAVSNAVADGLGTVLLVSVVFALAATWSGWALRRSLGRQVPVVAPDDVADVIGLGAHEHVVLVGGGGKSTLLFALGRSLAARGQRVVVTTTTKMGSDQRGGLELVVDRETPDGVAHGRSNPVIWWDHVDGPRALGVSAQRCDEVFGAVDHLVVEADGARRKPFKAPADYEPVVGSSATVMVSVIGADALGVAIVQSCHRPELVAALAGCGVDDVLTPVRAAAVLLDGRGARKELPSGARLVVAITKVAAGPVSGAVRELVDQLKRREPGLQVVVVLHTGETATP